MKLKDRVAIITGAGSGIGRAQSLLFASEGAIIIAVDINFENVNKVANEIIKENGQVYPVTVNVSDEAAVKKLISEVLDKYGRIDILCNTAGVLDGFTPSLNTSLATWDKVMNINVRALFMLTNEVLPHMLKNKKGVIVNIGSIASFIAGAGGAAYTTSKHAVMGYTRQMTLDYAKEGIRVNVVAPGLVETPMVKDLFDNKDSGVLEIIESIPARRAGQAHDIARASLFLASDDASYIFGTALVVDGGVLARL